LAVGYIQIQIKKALRLQHRQVSKVEVLEEVVPSRKGEVEAEVEAEAQVLE